MDTIYMDWILTVSGSDTDGSTVTIYHGVSIEDMKQIIVDKIAAAREDSFDFGTETIDDVEERITVDTHRLVSLYGFISCLDHHTDYEAHLMNMVRVVNGKQ